MQKSSSNDLTRNFKIVHVVWLLQWRNRTVTMYGCDIRINGNPACNYLFKANNRHPRERFKLCSKLTLKRPECHHWQRSDASSPSPEHPAPVPQLSALNKQMRAARAWTSLRKHSDKQNVHFFIISEFNCFFLSFRNFQTIWYGVVKYSKL